MSPLRGARVERSNEGRSERRRKEGGKREGMNGRRHDNRNEVTMEEGIGRKEGWQENQFKKQKDRQRGRCTKVVIEVTL